MPYKDLTFRLFGQDVNASASMRKLAVAADESSKGISKSFGETPKYAALAAAGVVAASLTIAAKFQSQMSLLRTAAGESKTQVTAISSGVQTIASDTGTSLDQLAEGAYTVGKAFGKEGAAGQLDILRAAAEGAKAEHVDLGVATNALTSIMTSYGMKGRDATKAENELIAASGLSKTTMQDFAMSLSNVLPIAAPLKLSFAQVAGAIATMTQHGETAQHASENLGNLITNLAGQNHVASSAMQQLGINTVSLQKNFGKNGLTGTLDIVEKALAKNSRGGMVVVSAFKQSANATSALNTMLAQMHPQARSLSEEFAKGSISYKEYYTAMKGLGGQSFVQASQFKGLYVASKGFNDQLKSGNPDIATSASMMQKMLGGVTGMKTALMLGGTSASKFAQNVDEISTASRKGGKDISTWAITQQNATVQLDRLKSNLETVGVAIGSVMLPGLTKAASAMADFFKGVASGNGSARAIAITIGVVVAAFAGLYVAQKAFETVARGAKMAQAAIRGVGRVVAGIKWAAMQAKAAIAWAKTAAAATISAARTAAAWVATQARVIASAAKLYVELAGYYAKSAIAAAPAAAKAALAWIASSAQAAAGWVVMKAQAIAAFAQTAAAAVVNGARMAAVWAAQKAAVLGYIAVQGLLRGAMALGTAAQWLFNAAMDANPIGLIVLAIAGLIAGIVLLVTHWKEVCSFLQSVWGAVCKWFSDTLNTIGQIWSALWAANQKVINTVLTFIGNLFTAWWNTTVKPIVDFFVNAWHLAVLGFQLEGKALGQLLADVGAFFSSWWTGSVLPVINLFVNGWKTAIAFVGGIPGKIRAFFANAASWLLNAGKDVISGLVKGITGAVGSVVSTVSNIAGTVTKTFAGVLGIKSPSRVFTKHGSDIVDGLVKGINDNAPKAAAASAKLASQTSAAHKAAAKTAAKKKPAPKPQTPAVYAAVATYLKTDLAKGLAGSSDDVASTMASLSSKVADAFKTAETQKTAATKKLKSLQADEKKVLDERPQLHTDAHGKVTKADQQAYDREMKVWNDRVTAAKGKVSDEQKVLKGLTVPSSSTQTALTTLLSRDTKQLNALAAQRDAITAALGSQTKDTQTAYDQLAAAQQAYSDQQKSVSDSVVGLGSITAGYSNADAIYGDSAYRVGNMTSQLQDTLAKTKQFGADLKTLLGMGLDPTTYQQLVSAGVGGGGLQAAEDLISQGAGSVAAIASLQSQVKSAGDALGTDVADQLDGAGVQAAQGLVNGLTSQLTAIEASMSTIADTLTKTLTTKLDIHSPSRVFEKHGKNVAAGLVKGIRSGQKDAADSIASLVPVKSRWATAPGSTGQPGSVPAAAGGRTAPLVSIDHFHADGLSENDVAASLAWQMRGGF